MASTEKTYLALGDSYTIGESVPAEESFPSQLTAKLNKSGANYTQPEIIAKTGWTSNELIQAIESRNLNQKFDLVTLLIGVNNQYRGYSENTYRTEFRKLLKTAIAFAGNKKSRVYVVSIPDWGVTPFAKKSNRDLEKISRDIDLFNAINKDETQQEGVAYIDITEASRKAANDITLIADDGLHPSAKMYSEWVDSLMDKISVK